MRSLAIRISMLAIWRASAEGWLGEYAGLDVRDTAAYCYLLSQGKAGFVNIFSSSLLVNSKLTSSGGLDL